MSLKKLLSKVYKSLIFNVKNIELSTCSCILKCLAAIVRMDKYFIRTVTPKDFILNSLRLNINWFEPLNFTNYSGFSGERSPIALR